MLQYTVYAVMMPFFGISAFQLDDRAVGRLKTGDSEKFNGEDGAENENTIIVFSCVCLTYMVTGSGRAYFIHIFIKNLYNTDKQAHNVIIYNIIYIII